MCVQKEYEVKVKPGITRAIATAKNKVIGL